MDIKIRPQLAGHALEVPDAFLAQEGVVHGGMIEGSRGESRYCIHDRLRSLLL